MCVLGAAAALRHVLYTRPFVSTTADEEIAAVVVWTIQSVVSIGIEAATYVLGGRQP